MTGGPSGVIVTMRHVRAVHMCRRRARAFAEEHGIDWAEFLRDGVAVEVLEATGDAMALMVAKAARDE